MTPLQTSLSALVDFLLPLLPWLRSNGASGTATGVGGAAPALPDWAVAIADKLLPKLEAERAAREALRELESHPDDEDVRGAFRLALRRLLERNSALDGELARLLGPLNLRPPGHAAALEALDPSDETLRRLEMVRLLRLGLPPDELARRFKTDTATLFQLNAAFSSQGVLGLAAQAPARRWFDQLKREDPMLRRLEMVRLLRSGVPLPVVAAEFGAVPEYVERLAHRFAKEGATGLIGETEARRYQELHPPVVRIATYNLHGVHEGDDGRYRSIARELSAFEPDLVAFQEVICGAGIRETSLQLAERMSGMAGADYRTFFAHCHLFQEKFPEGVALAARHRFSNPQSIDLNEGLAGGLRPAMPRFAAALQTELHGRTVAFASTHLDHASDSAVREAQARKLVSELDRLYPEAQLVVVAGDMNDVEGSAPIAAFAQSGFVDAFRACHRRGGATFTTADPQARIDFILVKGADQFLSAETALAHPSLSDHLGVFAVVR
ncbi:MAG: endonuclease/exonuclease/phosphatase family protein [Deltaproteobacteria bacterium]|nr:endonuclease/exonuclease/phosphatase family protein [Deltaproteobacteria bacterium]